jgi:hypothetical protein
MAEFGSAVTSPFPSAAASEMDEAGSAIATPAGETEASSDVNNLTMKLGFFSGELPHDDLDDLFRLLHRLSKDRRHFLLAQFFTESLRALREELNNLPQYLKELVPPFETILDLERASAELRKGLLCGAIERVILCILKIGLFIA